VDKLVDIDTTVPQSARVWNYWLGGKDSYPVDWAAGDAFARLYPSIGEEARASRRYLTRVLRYLAGQAGVRQFVDVGAGLPTVDNTHEVAQRVAPQCRARSREAARGLRGQIHTGHQAQRRDYARGVTPVPCRTPPSAPPLCAVIPGSSRMRRS
jgi:hypothetical protein